MGYEKPDRTRMETDKDGFYNLYPGQYPIVYGEKIEIPDGFVGRVYPRSRLMRSGLHLTSALWDQGYEGVGEGLLQIPKSIEKVEIEQGMPIAQMVFIKATEAADYDGSHQGEHLEEPPFGSVD
jgi:dUTP pyrophosphatase